MKQIMKHEWTILAFPDENGRYHGGCTCGKTYCAKRRYDVRRSLQKHAEKANAILRDAQASQPALSLRRLCHVRRAPHRGV